jgi:hypothetical protein
MDSHNCQRFVKDGRVWNEGDVQVGGFPPYPVSFRSLVPRKAECENLAVPVCVATSHIAYGSIRMEPVFMIFGQSAATTISMAIDENTALQDVNYPRLRERLLADGQILDWKGARKEEGTDQPLKTQTLTGILLDDAQGKKTGAWADSTRREFRIGNGYIHDNNEAKGELSITFAPQVAEAGEYEIFFVFTPNPNRASNVPITVSIPGQEAKTIMVDQKVTAGDGIVSLGKYQLAKGAGAAITISNRGTDGFVVVDGIQMVASKPANQQAR